MISLNSEWFTDSTCRICITDYVVHSHQFGFSQNWLKIHSIKYYTMILSGATNFLVTQNLLNWLPCLLDTYNNDRGKTSQYSLLSDKNFCIINPVNTTIVQRSSLWRRYLLLVILYHNNLVSPWAHTKFVIYIYIYMTLICILSKIILKKM